MASQGKAEGAKDNGETHTVRRVTVKQLFQAVSGGADDVIVDGQPVGNVTLVGKVCNFVSNATFMSLELDDGTGKVLTKQFKHDSIDNDLGNDIKDGIYVKVIGTMSQYSGEWCVSIRVCWHSSTSEIHLFPRSHSLPHHLARVASRFQACQRLFDQAS